MSLLTSPSVNKDQRKFLNRMERYYHKRAGSNYIPRQKTDLESKITTKIVSTAIYKIEQLMSSFMKDISQVVKQFQNIDHYNVLEILRKHQFFSDVSAVLNMDVQIKLQQLQKQCSKKQSEIKELKKQIQKYRQEGPEIKTIHKSQQVKYNANKSIAANLYCHAKALPQNQFSQFYNKICLSNPIGLQKVYQAQQNKQNHSISKDNQKENIIERLYEFVDNAQNITDELLIKQLIEKIEEMNSRKVKQCKRPCCLDTGNDSIARLNKAKTLMNTTFSKGRNNFYKSDRSEQYFTRYYRGSSFNVNDIISVQKTKRQQMEKLQDLYRRNLKMRHKNNGNHRYSSSNGIP